MDLPSLVAAELGLVVVSKLAGGEFGATHVRDDRGRDLVLKVIPDPRFAGAWRVGADIANRLHDAEYPAPHYEGVGVASGCTWSLQQRLPGATPERFAASHASQLLLLAARHRDAAGRSMDWLPPSLSRHSTLADQLAKQEEVAELGSELRAVLRRRTPESIRTGDACHGDFHHRNFLAIDGQVSVVFDWEGATPGDWRRDLVTLAFWSVISVSQFEPAAARLVQTHVVSEVPGPVRSLFAALTAVSVLDFYTRTRPAVLGGVADAIGQGIAPWWRD